MLFTHASPNLINAIESSERDYMLDRMKAIQTRPNNPEGVVLRQIGDAWCFYASTMPWPSFNTVRGVHSQDIGLLDEMIGFYKELGRKPHFEIVPSLADRPLLQALSERGFYQSGYHTSMYLIPEQEGGHYRAEAAEHIRIDELREDEFELYATIHCLGTGLPEDGIPSVAANNSVLYNRPGWTFYIARVDDKPAAVGVMHIHNGVASLTFAATLPEYRRQGLQQALLRRRILEAANKGCELIVSQCAFLSPSHRNMERIGMQIGYIRSNWTEL